MDKTQQQPDGTQQGKKMANPNPGREDSEIDKIFMAMACLVSTFSEDPVTKVGACIVNQDGSVVGTGYNSMPKGTTGLTWDKDKDDPHWDKYTYVCHAVPNAIMNAFKTDLSGCTIYTTLFPGSESAKMIIQAGIKKVVYLSDKNQKKPEMVACTTMLAKASVDYRQYPFPRDDESAEILIDFRSFYGAEELEELKAKFANSEG